MSHNLLFPLRIVDAGPNAGVYLGGPHLSPELMVRAERARKFFVSVPDDPTDIGPDPDYGL